jgi:two-component system, sensor histidine kinase
VRSPENFSSSVKVPWWTALVTLAILHLGTQISLVFKYDQGVADYYLPTAFSVLLINWWGPRIVLPVMYLNAVLSTYLWGIPVERWPHWLIYGIPETMFTFLSWFLFRKVFHGKYWLPDSESTIKFLIVGILIPIIPEIISLQGLLVLLGDQPFSTFWTYVARNWLGEFTSTFGLALPLLYYLTPTLKKWGLLYEPSEEIKDTPKLGTRKTLELLAIFLCLLSFVFIIEFEKYWYIYGLFSLLVAMRLGFGPAVITNYYIFLLTYILPKFFSNVFRIDVKPYGNVNDIFLGASLLFVFAALTARVISDLKIAESKLQARNEELDQTNKELDRFVYSVSHDLSAPLKSILGLVNISRLNPEPRETLNYLNRIESSVVKLEAFISEILDYSRNKRQEIAVEQIKLQELCSEILENLKYSTDFSKIHVDLTELKLPEIRQDKTRLRIILNNLLTNAVKFQKRMEGHRPFIKISSEREGEDVLIKIEDNGEGIRPELQTRIFDMFYRANDHSYGSGLGLYIAKEAANRIHGNISVSSEFGKGSTFIIELKNFNAN